MKWFDWEETRGKAKPEVVAKGLALAEVTAATIELGALRKARKLTHGELAERLDTRQPSVSKLESRRDMRVSTLREVVEAMGGELRITAHFPDADYALDCCLGVKSAREE